MKQSQGGNEPVRTTMSPSIGQVHGDGDAAGGRRLRVIIRRLAASLRGLKMAYVSAYVLRQTIVLTISFVYVRKVHFNSDSPGAAEEQEQLFRWLILLGANCRPLEAASVPCYFVYVLIPLLFYLLPKLVLGRSVELENSSLYTFLARPEVSYVRVEAKLEECIGKVLESNRNHLRSGEPMFSMPVTTNLLAANNRCQQPEEEAIVREKMVEAGRRRSMQPDNLHLRRGSLVTFRRLRPPQEPNIEELDGRAAREPGKLATSKMDHASGQLTKDIFKATCRQHNYLQHLFSNKSSLWPANRCEHWRGRLATRWLIVYVTFTLFIYCGSQGATQIAQWLCSSRMQEELAGPGERVGPVRRELHQMFLMDRLAMIEQSLFVWFACHYFVVPVSVMVATLYDQTHFLGSLNTRFERFFQRLNKSRHPAWSGANAQHRFECDREALEIYLLFQYFNRELRDNLKLIAFILNQYAAFMVVLVIGSVSVANLISSRHFHLLAVIVTLALVTTNCIFYMAAAFNADCINSFRLAWTLIAMSRPHHPRAISSLEPGGEKRVTTGSLTSHLARATSNPQPTTAEHLVTPHTLLLWRRLVYDHKRTTEQLTCRVFGLFHMDYSNLIRFNFWLPSVVMLMLTQYSGHCCQASG